MNWCALPVKSLSRESNNQQNGIAIQLFPGGNRRITHAEYQRVEDALMDSEIEDGFLQEEPSASQEFIPAFDGSGV